MEFKKAIHTNITSIFNIISQAQSPLKKQGIDQWQNNYPNIKTIQDDIDNNNSYILLKDHVVVGTVALLFDGEKTYDSIYNGQWLSSGPYGVIHRIAIDPKHYGLGLGRLIIRHVEQICLAKEVKSIRGDTHKENLAMQKLLTNNGFEYCGIIYLEDGSQRLAFEKCL